MSRSLWHLGHACIAILPRHWHHCQRLVECSVREITYHSMIETPLDGNSR